MARRRAKSPPTSVYRGVSKHSRTKIYDAYIWLPNTPGIVRRGSQRYIGGFLREVDAARAYDLARVKLGPYKECDLNLPGIDYEEELRPLKHLSFDEYMKHTRTARRKAKDKAVVQEEPAAREEVAVEDVLLIEGSNDRCICAGYAAFCSICPECK